MSDGVTGARDPLFQGAIDALAPPGLLIGHRIISQGDELALLDEEAASIAAQNLGRRRASGAARLVARGLMSALGYAGVPVVRSSSGAPDWPPGIIGSLAHDDRVAVAAVGLRRDFAAVGIDVEPAVPLPPDMLELVATPRELSALTGDPLRTRLLFVAKEAVYKAIYPLDRVFLEFRDIEIDLESGKARTRTGRVLTLRTCTSPHVVVIALN